MTSSLNAIVPMACVTAAGIAAMVAEAWYWLSSDEEVVYDYYSDSIWEIADRLRNRWLKTRQPVALHGSEINAARAEAARFGIENGTYSHNGIVGD